MIKEVDYQIKAVKELVEKTIKQLDEDGNRRKIVFEAPTGSGKTVMASKMLDELFLQLREEGRAIAVMWIAPNKLHEQSYMRMKNYFTESNTLRPVMYDELDHTVYGYIKPGEVFFVNWESINKESNLMVKETENSASLYDIVRRTKEEHGLPLIVVIDEEHRFTGKNAASSTTVLQKLNAKVEIGISATPLDVHPNDMVTVSRKRVIEAEMIKDGITINPRLTDNSSTLSENEYLLEKALAKREEIKAAYKRVGARINPLLLIQLPNDNKEALEAEEKNIIDMVKQRLEAEHDITEDNERLAVWLSGYRRNLNHIERNDSSVDVLLFKEAIALGWDCPRAAVLLIFRDIKSTTFGTQTVGRIMRMPEQKYYTDHLLNHGWVYTNLENSKIVIEKTDLGYITLPLIARRRENLVNVALPTVYMERLSADHNRLGPDFWAVLVEEFYELWLKKKAPKCLVENTFPDDENDDDDAVVDCMKNCETAATTVNINFNVMRLTTSLLTNVEISGESGEFNVSDTNILQYGKADVDINREFLDFCERMLSGFEKVSIVTLRGYLLQLMECAFGVNEKTAKWVILSKENNAKFVDVTSRAIEKYRIKIKERQEKAKERAKKEYTWEVPEVRDYNAEKNTTIDEVVDHALLPFIRLNIASDPEKSFETFLEQQKQYIDWWYKNGEGGILNYFIPYINSGGKEDRFYVDFVIRLNNGKVFLFDTKTKGSDPNAVAKHNALTDYMNAQNAKGKNLQGGVLIEENGIWKFCKHKIKNTTDLTYWSSFFPDIEAVKP